MLRPTEAPRFSSPLWLALLALLVPGCSVWQVGDVAPDYVNGSTHRGAEVLAFDTESKMMVSGGWDGDIAIWMLGSEKPERVWQAHDGFVLGVAFSGDQLVSGGQDGRLMLWSRTGQARHSVDTGSGITQLAVLNGRVVTGHYDGSVRAWTLPGFEESMHLALHDGNLVSALAVDGQSGRIASGGHGGRVFLVESSGRYRELERPPMDAVSLAFVPGGEVLYGGGWPGLYRWSLKAGAFETISTPHWGAIAALQYLPGENVLASISRVNDSSVFFLNPETGKSMRHFQRQSICGTTVRVSPDERYLAATGDDGIVRIWVLPAPTSQ
jgi:WD40 repeat protein